MDVMEKLVELSDIQVLQREIECVKRKSATNCADCLNCDLLMTDERILSAYANAIDVLKNANSVTVQEWISQTELPWMGEEIAKLCIRYMEDYADFHGYASSKKVKAHIVRLLELEKDGRIAILPQPPKGE